MNKSTITAQPQAVGHIHIDRVRVTGPLDHPALGELFYKAYDDLGSCVPVGASAISRRQKKNPAPDDIYVHSTKVQSDGRANEFVMEFCPPQLLQEHNFFGHTDIKDYVYAVFMQQTRKHRIDVSPDHLSEWNSGEVALSIVHLTGNFKVPHSAKDLIFDAIDANNPTGKHRDIPTCITLGFTEVRRSRHYMVTIYDKHALLMKQWPNPDEYQQRILELAKGSIRIEIKIYDEGLKELGLQYVMRWSQVDVDGLFFTLLAKFNVTNSIQQTLTDDEIDDLYPAERRAYVLWLKGEDLSNHYHRCTIAKYRARIKEATTIDIKAHRRPEPLPAVDFGEVLTPENLVPIPDWACGTKYYSAPGEVIGVKTENTALRTPAQQTSRLGIPTEHK